MPNLTLPEFWSDFQVRRRLLSAIRATMTRMERVHRRQRRDPVAELRASEHAASVADARYCEAANALVAAEREAIAAEIERTHPRVGKAIAARVRSRPDPLPKEATPDERLEA